MILKSLSCDFEILSKFAGSSGLIHSIFKQALVIETGSGMVSLVPASFGSGPNFVLLPDEIEDYQRLEIIPNDKVQFNERMIQISSHLDIFLDKSNIFSSFISPPSPGMFDLSRFYKNIHCLCKYLKSKGASGGKNLAHVFLQESKGDKDEVIVGDIIRDFLTSCKSGDSLKIEIYLQKLIGLGWNLTPSCDDMLLGMIAAGRYFNHFKSSFSGSCLQDNGETRAINFAYNEIRRIAPRYVKKTSFVSRSFLLYALQDRFVERLSLLLDELFTGDITKKSCILDNISRYGASSGLDILMGIVLALSLTELNPPLPNLLE